MWESLFADYPMRLIYANEEMDYSAFRTSLWQFLAVLPYRRDKDGLRKLMQENPEYSHIDQETAEAIAVLTNNKSFLAAKENYQNTEGDSYNMCKALEDLKLEGRMEGERDGEIKGTIVTLQEMGMEESTIAAKLQARFKMDESEAEDCLRRFLP